MDVGNRATQEAKAAAFSDAAIQRHPCNDGGLQTLD